MYYKIVDGKKVYFQNPLIIDEPIIGDMAVYNPTDEQLTQAGYVFDTCSDVLEETEDNNVQSLSDWQEMIETAICDLAEVIYND